MLQETAVVSEIKGDVAVIITKNQLACNSCQVSDACGNGLIEKYLSGKVFTSEVKNSLNAKAGDQVIVEAPVSAITKASLITYFFPILIMFAFVVFADGYFAELIVSKSSITIESKQIVTIIFAFVGLFFGFLITKYYNHITRNLEQYQIKMVKITSSIELK